MAEKMTDEVACGSSGSASQRTLTTQKVISVLKRAGFTKGGRMKSGMVRGYSSPTFGFRVERGIGPIQVYHQGYGWHVPDGEVAAHLSRYAAAIEAAGLAVTVYPRFLEVAYPPKADEAKPSDPVSPAPNEDKSNV